MNSTIKTYLQAYIDQDQKNQAKLFGMAMIAIKLRDAILIGVSLFFLQHGYYIDLTQLKALREAR